MSLSSVPKIQFTPAGLVIPAETAVLAGVQDDINAAFGGGLNPALETPQGQLASSQAAIIGDKNNEFALFVNQVDPQYSADRFQDAIARIYFLTRKPATPTSVQASPSFCFIPPDNLPASRPVNGAREVKSSKRAKVLARCTPWTLRRSA